MTTARIFSGFVCLVLVGCGGGPPAAEGTSSEGATDTSTRPGLVCIYSENLPDCEAEACCTPLCDTELGDGQCAAVPGTSCVSIGFDASSNYERVGRCLLPP